MPTCGYCGRELMSGARFCTNCGHRTASPDPSVEDKAAVFAQPQAPVGASAPAPRPGSAFLGGMMGALGAGIGCLILLGLLFAGCMALLSQH